MNSKSVCDIAFATLLSLSVNRPLMVKAVSLVQLCHSVTIACFRPWEVGAVTVPRGPSGSTAGAHHGRLQGKTHHSVLN